jgi:hypothetical protein
MPHQHQTERLNSDISQVGEPEQLRTPVLEQNIHSRVFGVLPEILNCASHTGKVVLPVSLPHPHHSASTSFVSLQEL